MNCRQSRGKIIDQIRLQSSKPTDPALAVHLKSCLHCDQFLRTQAELSAALNLFDRQDAALQPPTNLEARVLAAFDSHAVAKNKRSRSRWWIFLSPAPAIAVLVAVIFLLHKPPQAPQTAEAFSNQPFIQIPYVLPPAPYERTEIMRMDIPVVSLIAAGFDVHASDVGGSVRADVLVGQDGRAVAIRFISGKEE